MRFKSTLDSLKRLLNAFSKRPPLGAPDKRIVTSHNLPVNLPLKGQATAKKTVGTIETSSEKINLWTCCKGKIIGFKGQCEREVFREFLPKLLFPFRVSQQCFLACVIPHLRHACQVNDFLGWDNLFIALSCLFCPPQFIV